MTTVRQTLQVLLLRPEAANDQSFELALRESGYEVTILTSLEQALSSIASSRPDIVGFSPVSEFGLTECVRQLRASFDGVIVATGTNSKSGVAAMLPRLGITTFAATATELQEIVQGMADAGGTQDGSLKDVPQSGLSTPVPHKKPRLQSMNPRPNSSSPDFQDLPSPPRRSDSARRYLAAAEALVIVVVVAVVALLWPDSSDSVPTARALPNVPNVLLEPLNPLTLEELSGEFLPLKISGIRDRSETEAAAIAFWGDTAPDAFVTVNGEPVKVSAYGAFVVDYPLEDGANFIEVLASDFQGRSASRSYTLVRIQ
ncbi:MAG: hypothetical protein O3B95_02485 [Chloroflexi bacterium]|nr:hypothetical protein [Chloroflexota bacterium]